MSETTVLSKKPNTLQGLLDSEGVKDRLNEILGKRASTFASSVIQITQSNSMLKNAEPNSILGAAITSATLNLPLNNNLGYAYIIPFNERQPDNTYLVKAQFQIGYKGFIQLAQRSGTFKTVNVTDVRLGEIESIDRLSGEHTFNWIQNEKERESKSVIGYVGYFSLTNGFEKTIFMSMEDLNKHGKKFSQTFKKGFGLWQTDFDSMAKKTVLKLLLSKYAPLSIDMQSAVNVDQASFNNVEDIEDITHIDNKVEEKPNLELERFMDFIKAIKSKEELDEAMRDENAEIEPYKAMIKLQEIKLNKANK
jgi:recombination protein RecT